MRTGAMLRAAVPARANAAAGHNRRDSNYHASGSARAPSRVPLVRARARGAAFATRAALPANAQSSASDAPEAPAPSVASTAAVVDQYFGEKKNGSNAEGSDRSLLDGDVELYGEDDEEVDEELSLIHI